MKLALAVALSATAASAAVKTRSVACGTAENSWDETSGSAMFAYGMNEGVREGWLDNRDDYRQAVMKCFKKLASSLDQWENVPDVCIGTGAKNDRQYYLDRMRINGDPHGQAPLLWLVNSLMREQPPHCPKERN